ncbi:uncharacterized protein LOC135073480 [Ostrinia nubilalis]|uniref:uncharacterized protein LOC135073480 n=1 Tax=Ostrinia nubilalis TaxID=29057 RepID=UPI003082274F
MERGLRRQLGRALHLLGELHLRRERPELGTQHLAEAFTCSMGLCRHSLIVYQQLICQIKCNLWIYKSWIDTALEKVEMAGRARDGGAAADGDGLWKLLEPSLKMLGEHETAARLLTEMGALAMERGLRRQLGRALHLLGELHLRRERPELGTQHLAEAFTCFMGSSFQKPSVSQFDIGGGEDDDEGFIYQSRKREIFEEEAEQSRLMMAISAGQELMASYFSLLREAGSCSVAQTKTIEWKLSHAGWWVRKKKHDFVPCLCPKHNRTPLDILRMQLNMKASSTLVEMDFSEGDALLGRTDTVEDIRTLRSSYSRGQRMDSKDESV